MGGLFRRSTCNKCKWTGTGLTVAAAQEITENGTTLVLAAGNTPTSTSHSTIADIPGVILVSSINPDNNYYTEHARNQWIDLCAPGVSIVTTNVNNDYIIAWGTSLAAPFVTGTVALMLSVNPYLTPAQIETIIKNTTQPINNANEYVGLRKKTFLCFCAILYCLCRQLFVSFVVLPQVLNLQFICHANKTNTPLLYLKSFKMMIFKSMKLINIDLNVKNL